MIYCVFPLNVVYLTPGALSSSGSPAPRACRQARHRLPSGPTAVLPARSCRCRITLSPTGQGPFRDPESIQRTSSPVPRCKRDSAALRTAATKQNRMLKLLESANIKLASVVSEVFGVSGRAMLKALIENTATPQEMADLARRKD